MAKRPRRVKTLVREDWQCRALAWTGGKPQGTWGHQAKGFPPSTVLKIRQQFSEVAMLRRSWGCTTTAFALSVGIDADPSIKLSIEVIESWLQVLAESKVPKEAILRAWDRMKPELLGPRRWLRVKGPMAVVIATLVDMRWQPLAPTRWVDELGAT